MSQPLPVQRSQILADLKNLTAALKALAFWPDPATRQRAHSLTYRASKLLQSNHKALRAFREACDTLAPVCPIKAEAERSRALAITNEIRHLLIEDWIQCDDGLPV